MDGLIVIACAFGAASGFAVSCAMQARRASGIRRGLLKTGSGKAGKGKGAVLERSGCASAGMALHLLGYMAVRSRAIELGYRPELLRKTRGIGRRRFASIIGKTGLSSRISHAGFADARIRICLISGALGAVAGLLFSSELALALGVVFCCLGWRMPLWALSQERSARTFDMEQHLSEMIEVVALGLRSGLSFDLSFELYHAHFDTRFGKECASAQQRWSFGLASRENALRELAAGYDSLLLSRVVENIIRSIRFGSSLAESLEVAAGEARAIHKASMEEKVAKAPVKMLIPTATLILPAMLLLVLGPILLELMQGF